MEGLRLSPKVQRRGKCSTWGCGGKPLPGARRCGELKGFSQTPPGLPGVLRAFLGLSRKTSEHDLAGKFWCVLGGFRTGEAEPAPAGSGAVSQDSQVGTWTWPKTPALGACGYQPALARPYPSLQQGQDKTRWRFSVREHTEPCCCCCCCSPPSWVGICWNRFWKTGIGEAGQPSSTSAPAFWVLEATLRPCTGISVSLQAAIPPRQMRIADIYPLLLTPRSDHNAQRIIFFLFFLFCAQQESRCWLFFFLILCMTDLLCCQPLVILLWFLRARNVSFCFPGVGTPVFEQWGGISTKTLLSLPRLISVR